MTEGGGWHIVPFPSKANRLTALPSHRYCSSAPLCAHVRTEPSRLAQPISHKRLRDHFDYPRECRGRNEGLSSVSQIGESTLSRFLAALNLCRRTAPAHASCFLTIVANWPCWGLHRERDILCRFSQSPVCSQSHVSGIEAVLARAGLSLPLFERGDAGHWRDCHCADRSSSLLQKT